MNPLEIYNTYKNLTKTSGQKLIDSFDLTELGIMSVVIQKVINSAKNIYIITYDSRYPNRIMTFNDLKRIKGNNLYKLKLNLDIIRNVKLKLSMPMYLSKFNKRISTDSYVITRDLMGRERMRDGSLFLEAYTFDENRKLKRV